MEDGLDDLEKEVICLRELLSHLKLEEASLLKGVHSPVLTEEKNKLHKERLILQKKRKALFLEKLISEDLPEVATFLDQINSLKEKISEQRKINLELKKRAPYPIPKIEPPRNVKKKSLMLEDNNA